VNDALPRTTTAREPGERTHARFSLVVLFFVFLALAAVLRIPTFSNQRELVMLTLLVMKIFHLIMSPLRIGLDLTQIV